MRRLDVDDAKSVVPAVQWPSRAFLPEADPVRQLPDRYLAWEQVLIELPKLLAASRARAAISELPVIDTAALTDSGDLERAFGVLGVLGNAAVHERWRQGSATTLPRSIAVPWHQLATRLGRPPALSYHSHGLNNWRRLDPQGPVALGNVATLRNFLGGLDEDWFVLTHVDIEAKAGPLVTALLEARAAAVRRDRDGVRTSLEAAARAQEAIEATLARIGESCDPMIFFTRVQPFLHGFKDVIYEGVEAFGGAPQSFAGASGAQSAIVPMLDAVLGVEHAPDALIAYLHDLRRYMPVEARAFLADLEHGPSLRAFVLEDRDPQLVAAYDAVIEHLVAFRSHHLDVSVQYIVRPAQQLQSSRGEKGTGGSPFMSYLKKHVDDAQRARIG